jgi:hypothetical protein
MKAAILTAAFVLALTCSATAAWITPVGLGHSREEVDWGWHNSYSLIDDTGVIDFDAGYHSTDIGDMWNGEATDPAVRFDLGEVYSLTRIRILNHNGDNVNRALQDIEVYVSEFGETWTLVQSLTLPSPPLATDVSCATDVTCPAGTKARFFRISALNSYGSTAGLSEVKVDGTPTGYGGDLAVTLESFSSEETSWSPPNWATNTIGGDNGPLWQYRRVTSNVGREWLSERSPNDWTDGSNPRAWLRYDLGAKKRLAALRIWNSNNRLTAGVSNFVINVSVDGITTNNLGTFTLKRADDKELTFEGTGFGSDCTDNDFSQILELPAGTEARYVQLDILTNYGEALYCALQEVQFIEAAPPAAGAVVFFR